MTGRIPTEEEVIGHLGPLRLRDTTGSPVNPIAIF